MWAWVREQFTAAPVSLHFRGTRRGQRQEEGPQHFTAGNLRAQGCLAMPQVHPMIAALVSFHRGSRSLGVGGIQSLRVQMPPGSPRAAEMLTFSEEEP